MFCRHTVSPPSTAGTVTAAVCVALFYRYWGTVMVPGFPRVSRPQIITWCGRILTLHLVYVAGCTGLLLFLFERTHNSYVDNQGLVPWRLRRLGTSKVRSASLVRVLSDDKISLALGSQGLRNLPPPTTVLGYCGPRVCEISHFPRLGKLRNTCFWKIERKKKEKENPKEKHQRCSHLKGS